MCGRETSLDCRASAEDHTNTQKHNLDFQISLVRVLRQTADGDIKRKRKKERDEFILQLLKITNGLNNIIVPGNYLEVSYERDLAA